MKGQSTVKIILEEDTETLDEVVVVGYGVQKKSDVTGAMARVGEKELKPIPPQNPPGGMGENCRCGYYFQPASW